MWPMLELTGGVLLCDRWDKRHTTPLTHLKVSNPDFVVDALAGLAADEGRVPTCYFYRYYRHGYKSHVGLEETSNRCQMRSTPVSRYLRAQSRASGSIGLCPAMPLGLMAAANFNDV